MKEEKKMLLQLWISGSILIAITWILVAYYASKPINVIITMG